MDRKRPKSKCCHHILTFEYLCSNCVSQNVFSFSKVKNGLDFIFLMVSNNKKGLKK